MSANFLLEFQEDRHNLRIKPFAGPVLDDFHAFFVREAVPIDSPVGKGVVNVGNRHNPGCQRYFLRPASLLG